MEFLPGGLGFQKVRRYPKNSSQASHSRRRIRVASFFAVSSRNMSNLDFGGLCVVPTGSIVLTRRTYNTTVISAIIDTGFLLISHQNSARDLLRPNLCVITTPSGILG